MPSPSFQRVELGGRLLSYRQVVDGTYHSTEDPAVAAEIAAGLTPLPADPPTVAYVGADQLTVAQVRTTDATPTELLRRTLATMTEYEGQLAVRGIDAGNGVVRRIRADVVAKRLGAGALLVGAPAVIANHQDSGAAATTSSVSTWAITASVSGNDFVVTVTGAAGRTIDWSLTGSIVRFSPAGLPNS